MYVRTIWAATLGAWMALATACGGSGGNQQPGGDGGTQPTDGGDDMTDGGDGGTMMDGGVGTSHVAASLVAGSIAGLGSVGGTGSEARFDVPVGIAVDANGTVYVADSQNSTIRKVSPQGVVTTLTGISDRILAIPVDGAAGTGRLFEPQGLALDAAGNLYVTENHCLRKVTPDGTVTTLAGDVSGPAGSADGTGAAAQFNWPEDVIVDAQGNAYVVDMMGHTIRKVTPAGVVTTFAGKAQTSGNVDGQGQAARFQSPRGIGIDAQGNLWIADDGNRTIRKIDPSGNVTTPFGALDISVYDVAPDDQGNVYFVDGGQLGTSVGKVDAAGVVTVVAGLDSIAGVGFADGNGGNARFWGPSQLVIDGQGNLLVGDSLNDAVRKVSPSGDVTTLAGVAVSNPLASVDGTGAAATFAIPNTGAIDRDGNFYVVDNNAIRKVTPAGDVTTLAGVMAASGTADGQGSAARFYAPKGLVADANGNLFVADGNNRIRKVTPDGTVTTIAGGAFGDVDGNGTAAGFYSLNDITIDAAGNLYVSDLSKIRKITPNGDVTTYTTVPQSFLGYGALVIDANGTITVVHGIGGIRRVTAGGVVTDLGVPSPPGNGDGTGPDARVNRPADLALGPDGYVYVADTFSGTLRRIAPDGTLSTYWGTPGQLKVTLGPAPTLLATPRALGFAPDGDLVILDGRAVIRLEAQ